MRRARGWAAAQPPPERERGSSRPRAVARTSQTPFDVGPSVKSGGKLAAPLLGRLSFHASAVIGSRPQMHSVPLFRSGALRPLLDYLDRLDPRGQHEVVGNVAPLLRDGGSLLPLSIGGAMYARAAEALGASDLGLRVGEASPVARIGELGEAMRSAPTVCAALRTAVELGSRVNTGQRIALALRGDQVWLQRRYARALGAGRQQTMDFTLMMALKLIRLAAGPGWRPSEIRFEGEPPPHA